MRDPQQNMADLGSMQESMQQALGAFAPFRDTMGASWENYWRQQDKILGSMEEFAQGWFERRHQAARAALTATRRCYEANSPTELVREMQGWTIGTMQRMAHDGLACQAHMMKVAEVATPPAVREAAASAGSVGRSVGQGIRETVDRVAAKSKVA
jgi:hypothetical protein